MRSLWGFSDFLTLLNKTPGIKNGIVVDTNVLVSATYDFDTFYEHTNDLLNLIVENNIPLYCNVNVRAEFLEIQRRIAFTEALLSFEAVTTRSSLPNDLAKKLSSIRSNQMKREVDGRTPLRLSESEIKAFKILMIQENSSKGNLWLSFCKDHIGNQLLNIWNEVVNDFGLNFMSLRAEDQETFLESFPSWESAVELMSSAGLSSADAMIVNMFQSSKFELIISSDVDVGIAIAGIKRPEKLCLLPDTVLKSISIA